MAKPEKPDFHWPLVGLLLATLAIRATALWVQRANLDQDPDAYREIAENLLRHGEFALGHGENDFRPTAYRPPLYPLVLSNLSTADGRELSRPKVATLHLILGLATVWLTWLTARCLVGPGRRTAGPAPRVDDALAVQGTAQQSVPTRTLFPLLAGLLVACDPILLNQQSLVMTETLATFLAILSLWCLTRYCAHPCWFNAALAGSAIGLAILTRPAFLPWLALILILFLILILIPLLRHCCGRSPDRATPPDRQVSSTLWRLTNAVVLALFAAAILGPWAIRNYRLFGKPIVTTTHGGYTFLLGNNAHYYDWLTLDKTGLPWQGGGGLYKAANELRRINLVSGLNLRPSIRVPHDELELDGMSYELAWQQIRQRPADFVRACLYRITQLWSPLPHKLTADESLARRALRYATCAWYLAVYALAAVGVWKLRWNLVKPPWLYGILLCLAFTAVHTFYWTNLRMRAPLIPVVALIAGAAVLPTTKPPRCSAPILQPPTSVSRAGSPRYDHDLRPPITEFCILNSAFCILNSAF